METVTEARLYAILDSGYVPLERWRQTCGELLDGGADLIQLRAKNESAARRRELLEEILPLFAGRRIPLIVNDDIDLCLEYPGLGLHVGQDDLPAAAARERLGPDRILGLSTHSIDQAKEAIRLGAPILSYFAVGPVFATPTKPDYAPVGLELVSEVAALSPPIPFFCIGGVTRGNCARVVGAGARGVVIVSDILTAGDRSEAVREARCLLRG